MKSAHRSVNALEIVLLLLSHSFCRHAIDRFIIPHRNDNDSHYFIPALNLIHNPQARVAELDLHQPCQIYITMMPQRLSIREQLPAVDGKKYVVS